MFDTPAQEVPVCRKESSRRELHSMYSMYRGCLLSKFGLDYSSAKSVRGSETPEPESDLSWLELSCGVSRFLRYVSSFHVTVAFFHGKTQHGSILSASANAV